MKESQKILPVLLLQLGLTGPVSALDYVDLTFEDANHGLAPVSGKGYPIWTLPPSFDNTYGPGNLYEISDSSSHSGNYSLQFTYEGNNGFCNVCGAKTIEQKKGVDGADYLIAATGEDLTLEYYPSSNIPAPHAAPGKKIYNKSRGYSQWEITSISNGSAKNDKALLKLLKPGIGSFSSGEQIINGGDKIAVTRKCGMDGIIGKSDGAFMINRRSDCNSGIAWFGNIAQVNTADAIQPSGGSLFRRAYLKAELVDPPTGQKLNYARFMRLSNESSPEIRNKFVEVVLVADYALRKDLEPHVSGFAKIGGQPRYKPGNGMPVGLKFERSKWYYIEEEYKAETYTITTTLGANGTVVVDSYTGNGDGEYRLWFAESGKENNTPLINIKNLSLPPIIGGKGTHVSLWGNEGHERDTRGKWYIDDVKISNQRIGFDDVARDGKNIATTKPPSTSGK